jgi:hypothetical protein
MAYQIDKQRRRDKKRNKQRNGMTVGSKSVFLIERLQRERAEEIKRKKQRERKRKMREEV